MAGAAAPTRTLLTAQKIQALRNQLFDKGSVRVGDAARFLGVSDETIRRYLKSLAGEGGIRLVRGGAIVVEEPAGHRLRPPVEERARLGYAEKDAIGARAAALVQDGCAVLLDGGTTTLAVAAHLDSRHRLTILTNNLMVAQLAVKFEHCRLYVIGGKVVPESMSMVGLRAADELAHASVDWAFLGAAGISASKGFTSADPFESEVKKAMMSVARKVAIVADHSKMTASGFSTFARPEDVDVLVTSRRADPDVLRHFESAGIKVVIA